MQDRTNEKIMGAESMRAYLKAAKPYRGHHFDCNRSGIAGNMDNGRLSGKDVGKAPVESVVFSEGEWLELVSGSNRSFKECDDIRTEYLFTTLVFFARHHVTPCPSWSEELERRTCRLLALQEEEMECQGK
jgi:hypothetical protein